MLCPLQYAVCLSGIYICDFFRDVILDCDGAYLPWPLNKLPLSFPANSRALCTHDFYIHFWLQVDRLNRKDESRLLCEREMVNLRKEVLFLGELLRKYREKEATAEQGPGLLNFLRS